MHYGFKATLNFKLMISWLVRMESIKLSHFPFNLDLLCLAFIFLSDLLLLRFGYLQFLNVELLHNLQVRTKQREHDWNVISGKLIKQITSSAETEISLAFSSASWRMNLTICWICFDTSASFIFSGRNVILWTIWWSLTKIVCVTVLECRMNLREFQWKLEIGNQR